MVSIASLWLPILIASALVFVASSLIHMMLPWHKDDFAAVPDEDGLMDALQRLNVPPGDYLFPNAGGDRGVLRSEAFREKARKGPVGTLTVYPAGDPFAMGAQLTQWFLYCVLISVFAAYLTSRAVAPGSDVLQAMRLTETDPMQIFRFAGTTAFAGYGLALLQRSIWWRQRWSTTLKGLVDALVYALLTGAVFSWLWP